MAGNRFGLPLVPQEPEVMLICSSITSSSRKPRAGSYCEGRKKSYKDQGSI